MPISTGAAILGAGIIGGAASIFGGSKSSSAIKSAAKTSANATNAATDMQLEYLRETRADIADAVEKGLIDLDTGFNAAIAELQPTAKNISFLQDYANLLNNPEAVMDRPGVRFQYDQGIDALQSGFSRTSGGGLSGPTIAAAEEYGQNFTSTALDKELARISYLADVGVGATNNIANMYINKGTSKANLRVGGASGSAGVTGQVIPSVASNIVAGGNNAASAITAQASNFNNTLSGVSGIFSNLASLYAIKPDLFASSPAK